MVRRKSSRLYASPDASSAVFPLSMGTRFPAFDEVVNGFRKVRTGAKTFAWVPEQDLRLLKILPQAEARKTILESASELIGDPYFWGGASANLPDLKGHVTAVDCSGLVYLAYRVAGIDIPRDSLEQSMKARPLKKERLKPGDLIFSAPKDHPEKITHVALFVDEKTMIEAPKTGEKVRKVSFQDKYGVPFEKIEEGKVLGDRVIRFGTYFENR
jgi:cell wall-associated NlpC family hydrolase